MLIDLFADCLPNRKKRRWHFTTFMLETMAKLEQLRRSRALTRRALIGQQEEYSMIWLARDLVSESPIIFLDEFQLPDRAASKIMTNLMTSFFHLGGVLIATSNRMPEELAKAAGLEFLPQQTYRPGSLASKLGLGGRAGRNEVTYNKTEVARFLEVLRARCDVWEMENAKDYRRIEFETDRPQVEGSELENMSPGNIGLGYEQSRPSSLGAGRQYPANYFVTGTSDESTAEALNGAQRMAVGFAHRSESAAVNDAAKEIPWQHSTMRIYGRDVPIPRQHNGVSCWTFEELCGAVFGPADYITLAATFHTIILLDVPQLSTLRKNEARRLITLLDALYEARCKLLVSAAAGPDDLFFPDARNPVTGDPEETVDQDATYAETISEVYQDATAPFRPNISTYEDGASGAPEGSFSSSSTDDPYYYAEQGPDYTHSRLAGILSDERDHARNPPDQLEDDPPNRPNELGRGDSIYGRDMTPSRARPDASARDQRRPQMPGDRRATGPDFQKAGVFTGEDEKFAYKRARSRLWEMTGSRWWSRGIAPDGTVEEVSSWWRPLDSAARTWERPAVGYTPFSAFKNHDAPIEGKGTASDISRERDEVLFRHGASPFRTAREPPPKMGWEHVWGMVKWGRKAGNWGKGVEGLEERRQEKGKGEDDK